MRMTTIVSFLLGGITTYALLFVWSSAFKSQTNENYEALKAIEGSIKCPEKAQVEYTNWSLNGAMLSCKISHGPSLMATGGKIVLRSRFEMGVRVDESQIGMLGHQNSNRYKRKVL
jgi:hypothetical protein